VSAKYWIKPPAVAIYIYISFCMDIGNIENQPRRYIRQLQTMCGGNQKRRQLPLKWGRILDAAMMRCNHTHSSGVWDQIVEKSLRCKVVIPTVVFPVVVVNLSIACDLSNKFYFPLQRLTCIRPHYGIRTRIMTWIQGEYEGQKIYGPIKKSTQSLGIFSKLMGKS
jgi:hypothetical protein